MYRTLLSATTSIFSCSMVSRSGAAAGLTTSSGCGLKVTSTLSSDISRARSAMRASTSRWPRCTPSNVPTVTTVPGESGGNPESAQPRNRSVIGEHGARVPPVAVALGDRDERARFVHQRRAHGARTDAGAGDIPALAHLPNGVAIEPQYRQRRYGGQGREHDRGAGAEVADRARVGDIEGAARQAAQRGAMRRAAGGAAQVPRQRTHVGAAA